jgi:hypothetical protein
MRAPLNALDLETVNIALYVGYEIEAGPQEQIFDMYESYPTGGNTRNAIKQVLNLLGIQINGINC